MPRESVRFSISVCLAQHRPASSEVETSGASLAQKTQPTQAHGRDLSETHNKTISAQSLGTGFRPPHDFRRPGGRGASARDYRDALKEGRPGTRIVDAKGGAVRTWGPSDQVSSLTDRAAKPPGSTT